MRKSPTKKTILCAECSIIVTGASPVQKYCKKCSAERDVQRKRRWSQKNATNQWAKKTDEQKDAARNQKMRDRDGYMERGAARSVRNKRSIAWNANCDPCLHTYINVAMPFTYNFSKNRIWSMGRNGGHVYARKEVKTTRTTLTTILKSAGQKFVTGKVWIDILVQKPNHKGDAVNVVDLVCDAVKDAIDVDDRWFSIRRLDWEIVKIDPMIYVGVGQEISEEQRICSLCGISQPTESMFRGNRRECFGCKPPKN